MRKHFKNIIFIGIRDKYSEKISKTIRKKFTRAKIFLLKKKLKKEMFEKKINYSTDYLISYRNPIILSKRLLNKISYPINFHPSLPKYRGVGCYNRALLNRDKYYGATIHLIDKNIDHGKILRVDKFKIKKKENLISLINKTHKLQFKQINQLINLIYKNEFKLNKFQTKLKWSGAIFTKKKLNKLYEIKKNVSKNELNKIITATYIKKFKPYIKIFNKKFFFKNEHTI